jgi:alpha-glucosidase
MPITSGSLGRLQKIKQRGAEAVFSFESSDLVLTPLMPNVIRHEWMPAHWRLYTERVGDSYAVARRYWPAGPEVKINETAGIIRVAMGDILVEATREPFHLRYLANGGVFLEEITEGGLSWTYWDYRLRYALAPEDHFYGMGQPDQLGDPVNLDQRGHLREIWNHHTPPAVTIFPALLSLRGYALLVDNPCRAQWDLGCSDPAVFSYQARGGGLQYYVIYGSELARLLRTFLDLTGHPPLPPRWVFGLLQSRYGYRNRHELESIARTFRSKKLPCDGLILDVFWFREMGDLAFDPLSWPNAGTMITALKQQGFHLMVIEEPYLTLKSRNYPEARAQGYLAKHYDGSPYTFDFWPGECALVDFSNPAVRQWWAEKHRPLLELGLDGWWTDLNEPAKHFQDMAHHGGAAAAVHNSFPLHMQQAVYEAHQEFAPQKRVFILSRSAFPGSQRYGAALWSGDVDMSFTALRNQLAVALNVGLAGIPLWGSDIGGFGFGGECTAELYARWFEFGTFCPLCRPHGDQRQLREPWQFGEEIENICRKYLRLRYRLLPYIYSAAHEACTSGMPIMRPLILEFPGDSRLVNVSDEYLFGADILVAPVLDAGAVERSVYLPEGGWIYYWTDETYRGPGSITVVAPLDIIPLFIRQGAIIPMAPEMQYSSECPLDPLTLEIYRGADRSFTLYQDDGESTAYQNEAYYETRFDLADSEGQLVCKLTAARGQLADPMPPPTILLNVHTQPRVTSVTVNEVPLPGVPAESLETARGGWDWNAKTRILSVKLPPAGNDRTIRIF